MPSNAPRDIFLFDLIFEMLTPKWMVVLTKVISHELAHIYWDSIDKETQKNYFDAAGWEISKDQKTISLKRKNVSMQDSYIGPHEDFANSVELFLYNKETFKDNAILLKCLELFIQ